MGCSVLGSYAGQNCTRRRIAEIGHEPLFLGASPPSSKKQYLVPLRFPFNIDKEMNGRGLHHSSQRKDELGWALMLVQASFFSQVSVFKNSKKDSGLSTSRAHSGEDEGNLMKGLGQAVGDIPERVQINLECEQCSHLRADLWVDQRQSSGNSSNQSHLNAPGYCRPIHCSPSPYISPL
jgi:hypothetical protein